MALYHYRFQLSFPSGNASVRNLMTIINTQAGVLETDVDDAQFPTVRNQLLSAGFVPINITRSLVVSPENVA